MPEGGMCILPQPFFWDTITRRCWPGVIKLHSIEVSWFWGLGMPKIRGKLPFSAEFMLSSLPTRQFGYKKMNLLAVKLGKRGSKNHFLAAGVKVSA